MLGSFDDLSATQFATDLAVMNSLFSLEDDLARLDLDDTFVVAPC